MTDIPPQAITDRTGRAVMIVRQHLINEGCTIPVQVIREALDAAAPHLATTWQPKPPTLIVELKDGAITAAEWHKLDKRIEAFREQFTAEAVAAERERCAQLIEAEMDHPGPGGGLPGVNLALQHLASLLRQSGEGGTSQGAIDEAAEQIEALLTPRYRGGCRTPVKPGRNTLYLT